MAVPQHLTKLTGKQMKTVAFLLGLPTAGLKTDVQSMLARRVTQTPTRSEFSKILSIDMGIRNLGVCVLSAPHLSGAADENPTEPADTAPLTISAWEKVDVLGHLKLKKLPGFGDSDSASTERRELERMRRRDGNALTAGDFTPQNLAEAAYALVSSLLVKYNPTAILIERQRFRTASGPAVQEWTLRVNLLEHMIWACLETLRTQAHGTARASKSAGDDDGALLAAVRELEIVCEVSPAKVAKFWCGGLAQDLRQGEIGEGAGMLNTTAGTMKGLKITKAEKIAVAQGWVDRWKAGERDESVRLDFVERAAQTTDAFQSGLGKRKPSKRKGDGEGGDVESIGKLDDLADCLLQGVAWVKWEENRRRLVEIVAKG